MDALNNNGVLWLLEVIFFIFLGRCCCELQYVRLIRRNDTSRKDSVTINMSFLVKVPVETDASAVDGGESAHRRNSTPSLGNRWVFSSDFTSKQQNHSAVVSLSCQKLSGTALHG